MIAGVATEIGKTWIAVRLLTQLRHLGLTVAARKPVQSFDPADGSATDAELLAAVSGEAVHHVCQPRRCYPAAMAPPMAADALGRDRIAVDELLDELAWPPGIDVGLVETVGGVRSPLAHDADSADLARLLEPDLTVLVAHAGLGTINAVRLAAHALTPLNTLVVLNRYDDGSDLHHRNRTWLEDDGYNVAVDSTAIHQVLRYSATDVDSHETQR